MPVTTFSQNPNHMAGMNRFISVSGTAGATPRMRSATTAFTPATMPMPTVWLVRIIGSDQRVGESRSHMLSGVDSSQMKKLSMAVRLPRAGERDADRKRRIAGEDAAHDVR